MVAPIWNAPINAIPSLRVEHDLVDVAPAPGLSGLTRLHDGMTYVMEMRGRVLVLGLVAAANFAAHQAHAQVVPGVTDLEALLTTVRAGQHVVDHPGVAALTSSS
jgi:hypothetical protein